MAEENGNGHSHEIPRSVNIRKEGKVDHDSIQNILEQFKDVLISMDSKISDIKEKQEKMEKDIKPIVSFYRKVLTIVTFCVALFTAYKTGIWEWLKKNFLE